MATRLPDWPIVLLLVGVGVYTRGWASLRRRGHAGVSGWNAVAFFAGAATMLVAVASPIERLAGLLLQVHMAQHLLLMMVAPPLIWLGLPLAPMLRGLPRPIARSVV